MNDTRQRRLNLVIAALLVAVAAAAVAYAWARLGGADSTPAATVAEPSKEPAVDMARLQGLRLDGESVVDPAGGVLSLSRKIVGWVDVVTPFPDRVAVAGWAADVQAGAPARAVVVFVGTEARAVGVPDGRRSDVAEATGMRGAALSGFSIALDVPWPPDPDVPVRVFALDHEGRAAELDYNAAYPFPTGN